MVMVMVVIVIMIVVVVVVMIVTVIAHAVMAIPAFATRAVAALVGDHARRHREQVSHDRKPGYDFHMTTLARLAVERSVWEGLHTVKRLPNSHGGGVIRSARWSTKLFTFGDRWRVLGYTTWTGVDGAFQSRSTRSSLRVRSSVAH
jgi:hypothetical protein